ncbi:MAG: condensation domain-containing protein [Cyanobacteria bacterium P01_F01_bin.13]
MAPNKELYQRVAALSLKQREILAQHLSGQPSQQLVAYVVSRTGEVDVATLRAVLKTKLPNHMVPAAIMSLAALPRTANGKIDTRALPEPTMSTLGETVAPRTATERTLVQIWQDVLKLDTIGIYDNFFELGGDSILSIKIVSRTREAGLRLAPNQLFEQPTVAELAAVVNLAPEVAASQDVVTGEVPLTPIQHWFFEQKLVAPQHWHQGMLVEFPDGISGDVLERAIVTIWTHHDALRMYFDNNRQINADANNPPSLTQIDLSPLDKSEQLNAIADHGSRLHTNVNLAKGGLMGAALFNRGENQPSWLMLSLHHLVVDAVSWQILLNDLSVLLGGALQLPDKTTSFKVWAETLAGQAERQSEANVWFGQVEQSVIQLPRDYSDAPSPTEGTTQTVTVSLSEEDTYALLKTVPTIYNTQINDALLTALAQTLLQWVGTASGDVRIEVEAHGREQIVPDVDVSRTVGWFTTTYPVSLQIRDSTDGIETLKSVKEQLRQVPARGIGYGLLRYLGDDTTRQRLAQAPSSEILFNYLGQQNPSAKGLRVIQDINIGPLRDSRNQRQYPLEINAWVADGQLQISWRYDTQSYRPETLTALSNNYLSALKSLIAQCSDTNSGGFTPSDFPDAEFSQTELDDFIGQLTGEV